MNRHAIYHYLQLNIVLDCWNPTILHDSTLFKLFWQRIVRVLLILTGSIIFHLVLIFAADELEVRRFNVNVNNTMVKDWWCYSGFSSSPWAGLFSTGVLDRMVVGHIESRCRLFVCTCGVCKKAWPLGFATIISTAAMTHNCWVGELSLNSSWSSLVQWTSCIDVSVADNERILWNREISQIVWKVKRGNLESYREWRRRKVWCAMRQTCRNYSISFFEALKAWLVNKQIDNIPSSRPECNNSQDFRDAGNLLNSVAFYMIVKTFTK